MIMTRIQLLTLAGGLMLACNGCAQNAAIVNRLPLGQNQQKHQEIQFDLARLSEKQGKLQQAQRLFQELVRDNPNDANSLHRLGVIAAKLDQPQEANAYFMAALRNKPHDSEILTDLGYSLYLQNDLPAAETALRQARREDVTNERALNNLAMVVGAQGRTDESFALFRRDLSEAEAMSNVAYLQARTGDVNRATQSYSQALTLNSDLDKASIALLQIAERDYVAKQRAAYNANLAAAQPTPPAAAPVQRERPVFAEDQRQPSSPPIQTASSTSVRVMLDDLPVQPAVATEEAVYDNVPVLESIETIR